MGWTSMDSIIQKVQKYQLIFRKKCNFKSDSSNLPHSPELQTFDPGQHVNMSSTILLKNIFNIIGLQSLSKFTSGNQKLNLQPQFEFYF